MTLREDCEPAESPLGVSTGLWSGPIFPTDTATVVSVLGECSRSGTGNPGSAWWNATTFGPNIGIAADFFDATHTASAYMGLWPWISAPGTSGADGYLCQFDPFDELVRIVRFDNTAFGTSQLCDPISANIENGDRIACEKIGSTIKAYVKRGSIWTEECSLTDATYSGVGYVGVQINTQQFEFDNIQFDTLLGAGSSIGEMLHPVIP